MWVRPRIAKTWAVVSVSRFAASIYVSVKDMLNKMIFKDGSAVPLKLSLHPFRRSRVLAHSMQMLGELSIPVSCADMEIHLIHLIEEVSYD